MATKSFDTEAQEDDGSTSECSPSQSTLLSLSGPPLFTSSSDNVPHKTKSAPIEDFSGYATPVLGQIRDDTASSNMPSPLYDEGYSEDMVLSDEELGEFLEDDDDDEETDEASNTLIRSVPVQRHSASELRMDRDFEEFVSHESDADDEGEDDEARNNSIIDKKLKDSCVHQSRTVIPKPPLHHRSGGSLVAVSSGDARGTRVNPSPVASAPNSPADRAYQYRRRSSSLGRPRRESMPSRHLLRYFRNLGSGGLGGSRNASFDYPSSEIGHTRSADADLEGDEELTSDENSYGANEFESSSDDSNAVGTGLFGRMQRPPVWSEMVALPQQFILTASSPNYLDPVLVARQKEISMAEADRFVSEHGLLLQAALQLMAERDQVGVEGSIDTADNIWKKGPLKKRTLGVGRRRSRPSSNWKVKYVELRRGNLCYYEDSGASGGRKIIHLRQTDTAVRKVSSKASGYVFEVSVQGYPSRVWMANSPEERQEWMKAIQAAVIGETDDLHRELDLTPHQKTLETYTSLRRKCESIDNHDTYVATVREAVNVNPVLRVPLVWVRDQLKESSSSRVEIEKASKLPKAPYRRLKTSIREFWISMSHISFAINGIAIAKQSSAASQRTLGALTRCILEVDKAFVTNDTTLGDERTLISELQAVSFARDILMSVLNSKERQDDLCSVHNLLNSDLVVHIPREEESVQIEISFAGEDLARDELPELSTEISGWLRTKGRKSGSKWRKRFAVLSGSVLSYYEAEFPRPHGLQGQYILENMTTVQEVESDDDQAFVLSVAIGDERRWLGFEEHDRCLEWKDAIQTAIDSCTPTDATVFAGPRSKSILKGAERVIKGAIPDGSLRGGIRVIKEATGGGIKVIRNAKDGGIKVIRGSIRGAVGMLRSSRYQGGNDANPEIRRRPSMHMLMNNAPTGKKEPTVQCLVQASRTFDVIKRCEASSQQGHVLFTVRVKLFQAFLLSGGSNGRIARGNALVELEFLGLGPADQTALCGRLGEDLESSRKQET
ncbi:predicted protein [Phaeodactylum tricornutum CCAP 1055/1]|uniref:PH domain-containing protein n=1 Tax=Phaeodactylum tricornutum (strain CCAP 1055/1) TaxID=556484 RepID=B7G974_PHATC|nr:predicted protein [Phaeodactylum tricornutum CCAP 1055/1]EEC44904.1 predicted protein [Phaeodactylum tricornutum CCAP 1055/1]|eukprot:XP_002183722.1 predicted protein [Phaeodactylum tricornutum CCAP 1055/1]